MILNTTVDSTQTSADFNTQNMSIDANGRMFSLLLKNLYTDPYGAIVRELCTNALDAHVLVGNTNSFFVQLPSKFDSHFILRDFGPGLDDFEINKYLNTLFSSNKTTSNELAGGYGLGSKTPFALVDSFNIESYKNGIKYTGLWYKKECGTPVLIIINTCPTDEPNGLKFIVPCLPEDSAKFTEAFNNQIFNFVIKPRFFNDIADPSSEYIFDFKYKYVTSFENIKIFKKLNNTPSRYYSYSNSQKTSVFVSIGGVLYPYNNLNLSKEFREYVLEQYERESKNSSESFSIGLLIDIPIGSVTIPMNRESIEVTTSNTNFIQSIANTTCENWIKFIYKDLDSYTEDIITNNKEFLISEFSDLYQKTFNLNLTSVNLPPSINSLIKFNTGISISKYTNATVRPYRNSFDHNISVLHPNTFLKCVSGVLETYKDSIEEFNIYSLKAFDNYKKNTARYSNFNLLPTNSNIDTKIIYLEPGLKYSPTKTQHYFSNIPNSSDAHYILISCHIELYTDIKLFINTYFSYISKNSIEFYDHKDFPRVSKVSKQPVAATNTLLPSAPVVVEKYFRGVYTSTLCDSIDTLFGNYYQKASNIVQVDALNNKIKLIDYCNSLEENILFINSTQAGKRLDYAESNIVEYQILPTLVALKFTRIIYVTDFVWESFKEDLEQEATFKYFLINLIDEQKLINTSHELYNYIHVENNDKLVYNEALYTAQYAYFYHYFYNLIRLLNVNSKHLFFADMIEHLYANTSCDTLIFEKNLDAYIRSDITLFFNKIKNISDYITSPYSFKNINITLAKTTATNYEEICYSVASLLLTNYDDLDVIKNNYIIDEKYYLSLIYATEFYKKSISSFLREPTYRYQSETLAATYLLPKILTKLNLNWSLYD